MPDKNQSRRSTFWDLHDFSAGRGLEIGPLHRTIVTRDLADVRYVDVRDREGLVLHYAADAGVDTELIPEIDYALIQPDGRTLGLAEVTAPGAPFAWVVASHVIEHVPDLIGWLEEVAEITQDGGTLVLAVPDRRYCFDVNRPPTTVGQMVQAHLDGDTRPSVRAIYDYTSSVVDYDVSDLWHGRTPPYDRRLYSPHQAVEEVERSLAGTYIDCHVWLFTPQAFLEQMHELRMTGRSSWIVERLEPTAALRDEFFVVMRRLSRSRTTTGPEPTEVLSPSSRPDWLVPPDPSLLVEDLTQRLATTRNRSRRRQAELARVRAELREAREMIEGREESGARRQRAERPSDDRAAAPVRSARRLGILARRTLTSRLRR